MAPAASTKTAIGSRELINMTQRQKILIAAGSIILIILTMGKAWESILNSFLKKWELFRPTPYWDVKQWSWGYGTRVPGSSADPGNKPPGAISPSQAITDALRHANNDYLYLKPMIKAPLNSSQWAALLSFSYNLGPGNADNLVDNINNHNLTALKNQWESYINADGVPNSNLIQRRAAEWKMFVS